MTRTTRRLAVAVAALMACSTPALASIIPPLASPVAPISPSVQKLGTLGSGHPVLTFHGAAGNPTPLPLVNDPVPVVCAVGCQVFSFTAAGTTPFLVSVKDAGGSPNDGWDLYVYGPTGALVGSANGIGANGQAIPVAKPAPGKYSIVVTFTYEYNTPAVYNGEVRLMAGPSWKPAAATCGITVSGVGGCFELPALRAVPASDLHVGGLPPIASTPLGFPLPVTFPTPNSCYTDESYSLESPSLGALQHPISRCLRFTSDVQNVGAGLFDVRIPWLAPGPTSGFIPGQCNAEQAVVTTTGSTVMRPAGPCEFHPAHAHFHYRDLISFSLYRVTNTGTVGAKVASSLKESFCLGDDDYFGFGSKGPNGERSFIGQPGCNLPSIVAPPSVLVEEGISPGWGDVYTWDTPDQFIDVSTLAPGRYDLIERTNPSNRILVAGPQQTCALTQLHLTATAVATVKTLPSVPCPPS